MIRFTGINHLAMVTSDMDKTIRFWRDLLGMDLVAGLGRSGYRHYFLKISEHDMIAFFEWDGVEPLPEKDHGMPVTGPVAFDHISFGVQNEDDLWEIKDRLEAAGFWVSEVVDHGFIHSVYAFDPNNIPIEFSVCTPGVDLRKNPRMMDRDPTPCALEGTRPVQDVWPSVNRPTAMGERVVYPGEGGDFMHDSHNVWGKTK